MSDEPDLEPSAEAPAPPAARAPRPSARTPSGSRTAKPAPKTAKPAAEEGASPRTARSAAAGASAARTPRATPARAATPRTTTSRSTAKPAAGQSGTTPRTPRKPANPRTPKPAVAAAPAEATEVVAPVAPVEEALVDAPVVVDIVEAPTAVEVVAPVEEVLVETSIVEELLEAEVVEPVEPAAENTDVIVEPSPAIEPPAAAVAVATTPREDVGGEPVLVLEGLSKRFGDRFAVEDVTLTLDAGTFTGIVGPNGAGKTTTLSMITGLLRPTSGRVLVDGVDVWRHPQRAKRQLGVLPDRLQTFDRLTGAQLLYYTAVLHGLDRRTARSRTEQLAEAFKVEHAMDRLVTDYSSGMLKKIALAAALVHGPRLLVLDEPFESVDPVSATTVAQILRDFAAAGGTVLLSSHSMELVERICDHVAVIVEGRLIAGGTVAEVRGDVSLQERFIDLAGADAESIADLTWLRRFSG